MFTNTTSKSNRWLISDKAGKRIGKSHSQLATPKEDSLTLILLATQAIIIENQSCLFRSILRSHGILILVYLTGKKIACLHKQRIKSRFTAKIHSLDSQLKIHSGCQIRGMRNIALSLCGFSINILFYAFHHTARAPFLTDCRDVSGKLPTYPSPKPTLTVTSLLGLNVGLGEG